MLTRWPRVAQHGPEYRPSCLFFRWIADRVIKQADFHRLFGQIAVEVHPAGGFLHRRLKLRREAVADAPRTGRQRADMTFRCADKTAEGNDAAGLDH